MKKILLLLFLFLLAGNRMLMAETIEDEAALEDEDLLLLLEGDNEDHNIYKFPEVEPEILLKAGVRLLNQDNADRVFEFEYLKDSPWFQGTIHSFSYPHRNYLLFEFDNEKDHFADLRYAYSDTLFFRWNNSAVFHNLGNTSLVDTGHGTYNREFPIRDANEEYGIKNERNNLFLRLKKHDFPLHFYLAGWQASRKGAMQQRSVQGDAVFGGGNFLTMTTQARDVDWLTEIYTIGANSHLGPVEVDLIHKEKRFEAKRDKFLVDTYLTSTYRDAGNYPHNLLPDLRGSINTLKIHSTYTGRVVASATFSHNARENKTSGADSDAYTGSGAIHWIPRKNLAFNLKYLHRDLSVSNPSEVVMTDLTDPTDTVTYNPNASLSSKKDFLSLTGKYKPLPDLTLRARYNFTEIKRTNADLWSLQESTRYNAVVVSARKNFSQNLTGDLQYSLKHIDNPSYNVEPDNTHAGEAKISWLPHARLNLLFNYKISRMKRDELHFSSTTNPQDRKVAMDNFLILGTFTLRDNLILTLSHSLIHYEIEQDIEYGPAIFGGPAIPHYGVIYKDDAQIYTASLHYSPLDNLQLTGEVTHVLSSGGFGSAASEIGTYSQQDIQETFYRLTGEYLFAKGLTLGMEYAYAYFDDVLDNPYDSETDSKGHIILFTLSKQW